MENEKKTENSKRIQTSLLNAAEKKALVWLAERQPKWVDSDMLTYVGHVGAGLIALGFILSGLSVHFLWVSSSIGMATRSTAPLPVCATSKGPSMASISTTRWMPSTRL